MKFCKDILRIICLYFDYREIITLSSVCSLYLNDILLDKNKTILYNVYKLKHPDSIYKSYKSYKYRLLKDYYNEIIDHVKEVKQYIQFKSLCRYVFIADFMDEKNKETKLKYGFGISKDSEKDLLFKYRCICNDIKLNDPRTFKTN